MDFENIKTILDWLKTVLTELVNFIKTSKDYIVSKKDELEA